ncbi:MAG: LytTR family DNA-binding domain-containing protein [Bacteroidetes bacterium]|nr:LytTR family DNA-binding domain-containing protein [Bacteroidota bacterium]
MYNAIIIDDEPTARDILERHLSKIDMVTVVASCKNAMEGFSVLNTESVDLIFLDINMPEVTGIMFANAVKNKTSVIFTTAYREYAVEGFELEAVDYLMKPISLERLMKAVHKFLELKDTQNHSTQSSPHDFTFFRCERKMIKVNFDSILYIESCGDYIKVHTKNDVLITRETMHSVVEKLPKEGFIRTHRSFAISVSKMDSYTNEHINILRTAIPVSRSYREEVMKVLRAME